MMKKGLRIVILSLIAGFHLIGDMQSQQKDYYQAPLDIPLYLSGSFGELRGSHFHAGIDFKTQAEIGKNIYAAADGYISRIKIQTGGYGRALYINHPNGETTVYAHLHEYAPEIEKYVKAYQYRNKTHTLDLYLSSEKLKVQKGELIGISGNSGSSGGPHLHFEIRKSGNQAP
ncbi:MAG: M23 family metallopeptidase, partial [Bacteroidota bacterium]